MTELKQKLARLLLKLSYKEGDFTLTSGKKSDYYFDCKQTALHPEGAWLIGRLFLDMLTDTKVDAVAGMTLGADPLVTAVSLLSYQDATEGKGNALPACIIRKTAKGHGTGQYLEGLSNIPEGGNVVLLEDVVTTGGTLITSCERVRDAGFTVSGILCVLDRQEGGTENLAEAGFSLQAIFTRAQLVEYGK